MKEVSDKNTCEFKNLIDDLEKELQTINVDNSELITELKMCKAKNQKYKERLKVCFEKIEQLNAIITKFMNKVVANKKIQTDGEETM